MYIYIYTHIKYTQCLDVSLLGTSNQQLQGEEEEEDDDDEVEVQPRRAKLTAFKDCSLVNGRSLGSDLLGDFPGT